MGGDMNPKPYFVEGQRVRIDLKIGDSPSFVGWGLVRGRTMQHIVDFWLVEVKHWETERPENYPWSVFQIPHTALTPIEPVPIADVEFVITGPGGPNDCDGSRLYAHDSNAEDGRGEKLAERCPGCRACS